MPEDTDLHAAGVEQLRKQTAPPKPLEELTLDEARTRRQECAVVLSRLAEQQVQVQAVALTLDGLILGLERGSTPPANRATRRAAKSSAAKKPPAKKPTKRR